MADQLEYGKKYVAKVDNDRVTEASGIYLVNLPFPFVGTREVMYLGCSSADKSRGHMVVENEKDEGLIIYMFREFKVENGVLVMKNCVRRFLSSMRDAERKFLEGLVERNGL